MWKMCVEIEFFVGINLKTPSYTMMITNKIDYHGLTPTPTIQW